MTKNTTESDRRTDPLAGAAVGETRAFEHEQTINTVTALPSECYGPDRDFEVAIADVEVVDADHPDDPENVRITYEVEATKLLPPRWDQCDDPRTDAEETRARRKRWLARAQTPATLLLTGLLSTAIAVNVMQSLTDVTVNSEPFQPPTYPEAGLVVLFILWSAWFVKWAIEGGLPRSMGVSL